MKHNPNSIQPNYQENPASSSKTAPVITCALHSGMHQSTRTVAGFLLNKIKYNIYAEDEAEI